MCSEKLLEKRKLRATLQKENHNYTFDKSIQIPLPRFIHFSSRYPMQRIGSNDKERPSRWVTEGFVLSNNKNVQHCIDLAWRTELFKVFYTFIEWEAMNVIISYKQVCPVVWIASWVVHLCHTCQHQPKRKTTTKRSDKQSRERIRYRNSLRLFLSGFSTPVGWKDWKLMRFTFLMVSTTKCLHW